METMMFRPILLLATLMLVACSPNSVAVADSVTPTPIPTPTLTLLPAMTATSTPDTTATAQAQASATALAQATIEAQATATADAYWMATLVARKATAQANAAATKNALLASIDALVAQAGRAAREPEGTIGPNYPGRPAGWFRVGWSWKNFVLDVQFFNPADRAEHSWDYGFVFRRYDPDNYYILLLRSDGTWNLSYSGKRHADYREMLRMGNGKIEGIDLSPTGSNKVRLVVNEKDAFLYVNGVFVSALDVSANLSPGELHVVTGYMNSDVFPGLSVGFKDLSASGLP
jgi:hypothetical protein